MANLPAALPDFTTIPSGTKQGTAIGSRTHSAMHNGVNDELEILAGMVGIGASGSTPVVNSVRVGIGTGTAQWLAGLTSAYLAAGAVTQIATQVSTFSGTRLLASYADVDNTNGKVSLTTTGGKVLVLCMGFTSNNNASVVQHVALREDSGAEVGTLSVYSYASNANFPMPFTLAWVFSSTAAAHSWYLRHINDTAAGTTMSTTGTFMAAIEIKK